LPNDKSRIPRDFWDLGHVVRFRKDSPWKARLADSHVRTCADLERLTADEGEISCGRSQRTRYEPSGFGRRTAIGRRSVAVHHSFAASSEEVQIEVEIEMSTIEVD